LFNSSLLSAIATIIAVRLMGAMPVVGNSNAALTWCVLILQRVNTKDAMAANTPRKKLPSASLDFAI